MRRVFKNGGLQEQIETRGYVRIPLLRPDEIAGLRALYERVGPGAPDGFHATLMTNDGAYRKAVHSEITQTFARAVNELFDDYRLSVGNFFVKRAAKASNEVHIHQDWSFVDRTRFREFTIFCPLIDLDGSNGCLRLVPGSHQFRDEVRPNGPRNGFASPFLGMMMELQPYLSDEHLKAGEALIYDGRTLHASRHCHFQKDRVVAAAVAVPCEAQLLHYFNVSPSEHEVFEVDEDFYWTEVQLWSRPERAKSLGLVGCVSNPFTRDELAKYVKPA